MSGLRLVAVAIVAGSLSVVMRDGKRVGYLTKGGDAFTGRAVIDGLHVTMFGHTEAEALDSAEDSYDAARKRILTLDLSASGPTAFERNREAAQVTQRKLRDLAVFGKLDPTLAERTGVSM